MKPPVKSDAGGRWGDVNQRFREFVERHPEGRLRSSFSDLHEKNPLEPMMSAQSWPFFASAESCREVGRVAVGIDQLFRSVFTRFFAEDPARIAAYYGLANPEIAAILLARPNGIAGAMSRADCIETTDGMVCLEYNAGSYLGGWQVELLEDLYRDNPLVRRFLAENGLRISCRRMMTHMFRHMVQDTVKKGICKDGELNLAIIYRPNIAQRIAMHPIAVYAKLYAETLQRVSPELSGHVVCCGYDDLESGAEGFTYRGRPIHALFEQHSEMPDRQAFRWLKAGRLNLFSGLITGLLSDKRNLALLSENASSPDLTRGESRLVERHIPWTRRAVEGEVLYEDRKGDLLDLVLKNREKWVLKKGVSMGGKSVHVGPALSQAEWEAQVRAAFADGSWIVQSYCDGVPYLFQTGEEGVVDHDIVFGLYVLGGTFGGVLLRLQPQGQGGVVNIYQGAEVGLMFGFSPFCVESPPRSG